LGVKAQPRGPAAAQSQEGEAERGRRMVRVQEAGVTQTFYIGEGRGE